MGSPRFKIWRILEEQESPDGKHRAITKKEYVGDFENPKQEIYLTWYELVAHFGEGYYLVEIPAEIRRHYAIADVQLVRTPAYFEPSPTVHQASGYIVYSYRDRSRE